MTTQAEVRNVMRTRASTIALVCGVLGIVTAVWTYWLVAPGIVLGLVAIVAGSRSRRRGDHEAGSVAVALGVVALFLVPSILVVANEAEDFGRNCGRYPTEPDC